MCISAIQCLEDSPCERELLDEMAEREADEYTEQGYQCELDKRRHG